MRSVGFLLIRVVVGGLIAGHGAQKLFGAFGGAGIEGTTGWLASMRLRPAGMWARAAGGSEFFGGLLTGSVGGSYRGEAILTNEGGSFAGKAVQPISQDSYTLYDAWLGWLSPGASWRFALTGRNLTDEKYRTNGYNIPALGVRTGAYGDPRVVTLTVEYRFF